MFGSRPSTTCRVGQATGEQRVMATGSFSLEESGALFTGDHVMGWSTSVVIPDMYKGLDPRLIEAAEMSVTAHLLDLEKRGMAHRDGEVWHTA